MSAKKQMSRSSVSFEQTVEEDIFHLNPLDKFYKDHAKHMLFIHESIRFRRRDQLVFSAQTLKLNLSHCGFVKAYETAAQIEIMARQNEFDKLHEIYSELIKLIEEINLKLDPK